MIFQTHYFFFLEWYVIYQEKSNNSAFCKPEVPQSQDVFETF